MPTLQPNQEAERFIKDSELGNLLRITRQACWQLRQKYGMPFFRIGKGKGVIRYRMSEIEDWLASRKNDINPLVTEPPPQRKRGRPKKTQRSCR